MTNLEKKQLIIKIKNDYSTDDLDSLDEWEDKIIEALNKKEIEDKEKRRQEVLNNVID